MLSVFTLEYKQGFSNIRGPTDYLIMRSSQPVLFFFCRKGDSLFSRKRDLFFSRHVQTSSQFYYTGARAQNQLQNIVLRFVISSAKSPRLRLLFRDHLRTVHTTLFF